MGSRKIVVVAFALGLLIPLLLAGSINRGTKSTGGTDFVAGATITAAEFNTDLNTIYNEVNGQLDDANIDELSWSKLIGTRNPEDLDDSSADVTEGDATESPGTAAARFLATDFEDEIQDLRYTMARATVGPNAVRRDTSGTPANVPIGWIENPARGENKIENGHFHVYSGVTANQDPPDGWTAVGTPTTLSRAAASVADGRDIELQFTADAIGEGITQTIDGLKSSTRYLLQVEGRVSAGDTVNITTTLVNGTDWDDAALVLDQTTNTVVSTVLLINPTAAPSITLSILSSAIGDNVFIRSVELIELSETPITTPNAFTLQSQHAAAVATGLTWADLPSMSILTICPGHGYEIFVHADLVFGTASAQMGLRIQENGTPFNTTAHTNFNGVSSKASISYLLESCTPGTAYTYTVQSISNAAINFCPIATSAGQTTANMFVTVRRKG